MNSRRNHVLIALLVMGWASSSGAAAASLVKNLNASLPIQRDSNPGAFAQVGGTTFFRAQDEPHGQELWKSDSTSAGTVLVKDIWPGADGSRPSNLINFNGTLFFTAYEPN